jgi:ureidoacrylate peracid hydrolase
MHLYMTLPQVRERTLERMGKLVALESIEGGRAALVVIDMQNYFCAPGFPAEVPIAREIVPNINRLANAVRAADGRVVWVRTSAKRATEHWHNFQTRLLSPERQRIRLAGLDDDADGFALYSGLHTVPGDIFVTKTMYSAFIPGSSDIDPILRAQGIDTVLVAGTLTNVCCESSARDAMMLDYKVVMVADANATQTDEEHAAALNTFAIFFGDVMTTEETIARLSSGA